MTLALSACVKETIYEPSMPSDRISFLPAAYRNATKVLHGSVYPTGLPFGCYAFYRDSVSATNQNYGQYMDNERISYSGSEWLPSVEYYWPRKNRVSFISYAPYDNASPWVSEVTDTTLTAINRTPGSSDDWLISDIAAGYKYDRNAVPSVEVVPVLFRHALSRVKFNIRATRVDVGGGTGSVVNTEEPRIDSTHTGNWVDAPSESRIITEETPSAVIRTAITVQHRVDTVYMSQTSTTTTLTNPTSWTIKVSNVSFASIVNNGTLELQAAPGHRFNTTEQVGWRGGWRLADGQTYATNVALTNALGNTALTTSPQTLVDTMTVIPQALDHTTLHLEYTSQINATEVVITTDVAKWKRVVVLKKTHVLKQDILNGKTFIDEDQEDVLSDTPLAATHQITEERPSNPESSVVTFRKTIGLKQDALPRWDMGKVITYTIAIEPTGKRITWDPAQVEDWGSYTNGSVTIN